MVAARFGGTVILARGLAWKHRTVGSHQHGQVGKCMVMHGQMHGLPLHLGCFRERREKIQEKEPKTRKESTDGERQRGQSRRDEVACNVEGWEMIQSNMTA